jgi:SpoVK/Ycf46/Vps4 family AAA+-type ATPase
VTDVELINQVRTSERTPILSVLLEGLPATGKTAIAASVGVDSEFPFVRVLSSDSMLGFTESAKVRDDDDDDGDDDGGRGGWGWG